MIGFHVYKYIIVEKAPESIMNERPWLIGLQNANCNIGIGLSVEEFELNSLYFVLYKLI